MTVSATQLREAMRAWATGVTIVTAAHEGNYHGMTVSSFTSLSLEPPLVLVSLERNTRTHELVMQSGGFGVSVLGKNCQDLSNRFASPQTDSEFRFGGVETHTLGSGVPFISTGLAFFDNKVVATHDAGTHTVFIGEVLTAQTRATEDPLLYFNQSYRELK
jgi:flavin reductase (DIM6/NTAB) family NADH-FMN oxidoreductase RutF